MTSVKTIIDQLKTVKEAKGYTYQDIVDMTAEAGQPVSMSTVRRVFGDGSDAYDFRYATTIQPIATALLGIEEETEPPDKEDPKQDEEYYTTIEAMKSVLLYKNDMIMMLQKNLDEKSAELDRAREDFANSRVEYQKGISDRNRTIRNLYIALFVLLAIIFGIVALDLALGGYGWFRRAAIDFMSVL